MGVVGQEVRSNQNMETILDISNQGFNTEKCLYNCWRVWGSEDSEASKGLARKVM